MYSKNLFVERLVLSLQRDKNPLLHAFDVSSNIPMNHYPFIWGFSIVLVLRFSLRRSWSISIPLSNGPFDIPCAWPPSPIKIFDLDGITERQNVYKHVYTYLKDTFYICMKKLLVIYDSILLVSNEDLFFDQLYLLHIWNPKSVPKTTSLF